MKEILLNLSVEMFVTCVRANAPRFEGLNFIPLSVRRKHLDDASAPDSEYDILQMANFDCEHLLEGGAMPTDIAYFGHWKGRVKATTEDLGPTYLRGSVFACDGKNIRFAPAHGTVPVARTVKVHRGPSGCWFGRLDTRDGEAIDRFVEALKEVEIALQYRSGLLYE